jgi:bacterioferritin-associated ferredoxin
MYICICSGITEREIRGAADLGSASIADLRRDLGVASCCGKCEPDARRILGECGTAGRRAPPFAPAFAAGD